MYQVFDNQQMLRIHITLTIAHIFIDAFAKIIKALVDVLDHYTLIHFLLNVIDVIDVIDVIEWIFLISPNQFLISIKNEL
jgi:hypothetical protein